MIIRSTMRYLKMKTFKDGSRNASLIATTNENEKNIKDWKMELKTSMRIFPDFLTPEEEASLFQEVDPYMSKLQYEFAHWDDAIHGYRETERSKWNAQNIKIINRVRKKAFPPGMPQLGLVHVLDLAAEGKIKPHVDSIRFCGDVIAGLSLLSDSVMRLTMVGQEQTCRENFLLPRRSLYIMSGIARQRYNHEILGSEESYFEGKKVPRARRISVICRSEVDSQN